MASQNKYLVVTPYHTESRRVAERCVASVAAQTVAADHLLIADGHGADFIDDLPVRHVRLDREHRNAGNTPRGLGCMLGMAEGYEGIALLDIDNWLEPDHIETCLATARDTACDYVVTQRFFARTDGSRMPLPDEPTEEHVDTNCFFFLEGCYPYLFLWGNMPTQLALIGDRIFYTVLRSRGLKRGNTGRPTVNYQVNFEHLYRMIGEAPPPDSRPSLDMRSVQYWIDSLDDEALRKASLRAGITLKRSS